MRSAIREMNVEMIDAFAAEELGKIGGIPGPRRRLHFRAVFSFVRIDQSLRPSILLPRVLFPKSHDGRRRRVVDRGLELSRVGMPNACQRRMNRPDDQLESTPLQFEHFHVAKRLPEDWVTRVKIAETHEG